MVELTRDANISPGMLSGIEHGKVRPSLKTIQRISQVLDRLAEGDQAAVVVSRPYNGCDPGANLGVPDKLRDLGVTAIPLDMLPLDLAALGQEFPHMYWKYGQRILAGARFIAERPNLHAVYVTNFRCGPDSFICKFFDRLLGQPYLTIEIDVHDRDSRGKSAVVLGPAQHADRQRGRKRSDRSD